MILNLPGSPRRRRRGRQRVLGRDRICTTQVKKAKKKEEIRIAREKAEKRIAAALEANNAKQRRKREVFDAKQVEVRSRRPVNSWPSHVHESGFFFEFELFRAASGPRPPFESRCGPNRFIEGPETTHLHH